MKTITHTLTVALFSVGSVLSFAPTAAQADDPMAHVARLDVLPGWRTADGTHMAAIQITLDQGWHTYWRAPGDAGIPAQFAWDTVENAVATQMHWPTPKVIHQDGKTTFGYYDRLVLPIEVAPANAGQPIRLSGEVTMGVCANICVPRTFSIDMTLPNGGGRDGTITGALLNQPLPAARAGASDATCDITPTDQGFSLTASFTLPPSRGREFVVVEPGVPEVWVSSSTISRDGDALTATVDMAHFTNSSFALDRSAIRITVFGDEAIDVQGCHAG